MYKMLYKEGKLCMKDKFEEWVFKRLDEIIDKINDRTLFYGYNENLVKKFLFEEQAKMHAQNRKIKKCICPNCDNKSIKRSHTIPRGMTLDIIAENNKVVTPIFIEKYPVSEHFIGVTEIGVGQASTFPGFCKEHELIFQSYEKEGVFNKEDDVIKQLYRNVAYNVFRFEKRIKLNERITERYREARNQAAYNYLKTMGPKEILKNVTITGDDWYIKNMTYHSQQLLDFQNKLEKYIMNLWKIISGNDADVTAESVILDLVFPVSICGCTEIILNDKDYICSVDVVPNDKKTLVTIGICGEITPELRKIVESRLNHPLAILNFIEATMIYGTDNWYLNPKIWNILRDERKESLLSEMQNLEKSIFDELPYSIFDDIRKYMISKLDIEEKYMEHELEKMEI